MIKNLLFILLLLNTSISFSQTNTITLEDTNLVSSQRWRDTCFGLIDKSAVQIPSGYLLDYSLVNLNDSSFNGINTKNDTIAESGQLFALHNIFTLSKVNTNGVLPTSTDTLFIDAYRSNRNTGNIPLLFLYQPYQVIRSTALSQGLFTVTPDSVRLKDVTGRSISPYDNKVAFAFSPLLNSITQFNKIVFSLPSEFWLMNGITSVSIDFGDGNGFQTLNKNAIDSIYYNTEGIKYLTAKITTTNGVLTAKSSIQYNRPIAYLQPDTVYNISVPPVYIDMSQYLGIGNSATNGSSTDPCIDAQTAGLFEQINCDINPGAKVTTIYGCDRVFDKPIIIVEGFDPTNSINAKFLIYNFDYFYSFMSSMRASGYDFVFVDFTKNNVLIENNAKVLEQVINNVNSKKTGSAKSIIIGWSMGGLVARWCLKDMEDRGLTHNVGKYFSYDVPNQGANIPLGLQYLFQELQHDMPYAKYFKQFRQISDAYASDAAREMLVTKGSYDPGVLNAFNWNPNLYTLDPARSKFAQALITKGYPSQSINYAISFGRGNNTAGTKNAGDGVQFGNFTSGSAIFDGIINYKLVNMHGTSYAVPENSINKICAYRYFGLKVVSIFGVTIPVGLTLRIRNFKYQGVYPYDEAPGGYENTQSQFADNFNGLPSVYFNGNRLGGTATNYNHLGHAFIPVPSALDLQNQGYGSANSFQSNNLYYNIDNSIVNPGQVIGNTLNPSSLSPFNFAETYTSDCAAVTCQSYDDDYGTYEGANWNLHHDAPISNQVLSFISRKILNANPTNGCPNLGFCNLDYHITTSNSPICNTAILKLISAYPIEYNINWTFPNGLLSIQNGQGTPNVTVKAIGNGTEIATAVITNSCGQQITYTLSLTVGSPNSLTGTYSTSTNTYPIQTVNFVPAGFISGSFQWPQITNITVSPGSGSTGTGFYSYGSNFSFTLGSGQAMYLNFNGTGLCGPVSASRSFIQSGGYAIIVSPNPTASNLNVSIKNITDTSTSPTGNQAATISNTAGITKMYLYDFTTGNLIKQWSYQEMQSNNYNLDIAGVKPGAYILKMERNNKAASVKVIVQ